MTTSDNTPTNSSQNTLCENRPIGRLSRSSAVKRKSVSALMSMKPRAAGKADPHDAPANDNRNEVAILRRDGHDPAIVIGLALRYVRLGRDVPFGIVNALFRHAEAGNGAARATIEMLRRRVEHRQHERWRLYVGKGLRAPSLPGPHGQADRIMNGLDRSFRSGRGQVRPVRLVPVSDRDAPCDGEAGR